MRAIIEIFLAMIFTVITGTSILNFSSKIIKREAFLKVQKGLPPLVRFTKRLTKEDIY